jgi:hypothetical protein
MRLTNAAKASLSLLLVCGMNDAWRRTVFYFDCPRFEIFQACHDEAGQHSYDLHRLKRVLSRLQQAKGICPRCLDPDWTDPLVVHMATQPRHSWQLLVDVLVSLRINSNTSERAHLPGEETKPGKVRGRALSAPRLAAVTYHTFGVQESVRTSRHVSDKVLKAAGLTQEIYSRLCSSFSVSSRSSAAKIDRMSSKSQKSRKCQARSEFRREHFSSHALIGSDDYKTEESRVAKLWADLPFAEKDVCRIKALGVDEAKHALQAQTTLQGISTYAHCVPANAIHEAKRQLAANSAIAMDEHIAWKHGLGVMSYGYLLSH